MLRIAEEEGSAAVREPKRGPNSLDMEKVKRNQLQTPRRYEYSDVYTHGHGD